MNSVTLPRSSSIVSSDPNVKSGTNYSMYIPQKNTKTSLVRNIIRGAEIIMVWDPSFNSCKDPDFYSYINKNCIVEVLTICGEYQDQETVQELSDNICDKLRGNGLDFQLTIYAYKYIDPNKLSDRDVRLWHDRYLFVKRNGEMEYYLVGTSVASHLGGRKAFGVYKLEDYEDCRVVIETYKYYKGSIIKDVNGYILETTDPKDFSL